MTLFYLSTTDIHELRSPSTLGPAYGVAFETHEAAAMALAAIDEDGDLEIIEADVADLPSDVRIPAAGFAVIAGSEGPIYGVGTKTEDAEEAARDSFDPARDAPEIDEWRYAADGAENTVYLIPCTQDVIDAVEARGGNIGFQIVGRGSRAVAVKA